ncbi:dnaJ homolog subfamily C member 21 [Nilaparvata lugens]|uniref:dnaJ homolog subfamily C member 21 n=1 Tax=Nilaparvata lugens TaxID=108931 RepID=UPI00193E6051|nr:dnaJ homolog subfamily C member 21 [Nilaparvata lugens]
MKCHYEVLNVPRDAEFEEIKKSYRKLAIKWHPDKNLENTAEATEQFKLIQQAFEVLSDPHERKWYDDHREAIIKGKSGGEYEDNSLDVYEFFTTTCFKGYGDDRKGFYTIYREVFEKIAAEDSEYQTEDDSDADIPSFGKSDSSFEDVNAFYAYWQSYSTKKSYAWLDPYNAREAPNRRVSKLIDKENKKVRDKARKARNEEVRELVGFVRKRDKRVQAYVQHLKDVAAEKAKKSEEQRIQKIKERNEELASFQESEWSKFSNVEKELKNMEASLAAEFGDQMTTDEESDEENPLLDSLYCIACEKLFKNPKAFANHESSKKHKENVQLIKESMLEEEEEDEEEEEVSGEGDEEINSEEDEDINGEVGEEEINGKEEEENISGKEEKEDIEEIIVKAEEDTGENDEEDLTPSDLEEEKILKRLEAIPSDDDGEDYNDPVLTDYIDKKLASLKLRKKENSSMPEEICETKKKLSKKQKKKQKQNSKMMSSEMDDSGDDNDDDDELKIDDLGSSKKQRKKKLQMKVLLERKNKRDEVVEDKSDKADNCEPEIQGSSNEAEVKSRLAETTNDSDPVQSSSTLPNSDETQDARETKSKNSVKNVKKDRNTPVNNSSSTVTLFCQVCKAKFPSKNKLFQHLEKTKHAVYIPDKSSETLEVKNAKSGKAGSKKKSKK